MGNDAKPQLPENDLVGWTKAEYDACPELASRLHTRILDLQDERDRYRQALILITRECDWGDPSGTAAVEIAREALGGAGGVSDE